MMGDIYIAAHLRRCLRHSVIGHVLQHTPSPSVLDALHLHHAVKSPPLRHPFPSHRAFIEAKNEPVKTKHVFQMKENTYTTTHQKKKTDIDTHTIMYQAKSAGRHIETIMYPAKFAGGRIETIMYPANFPAPGRGIDLLLPSFLPSREEKKKQERRKQSINSGAKWHTPHMDRVRIETKMQEQIFCPIRGHVVGRMQYAPTSCRQERLLLINSREERIETKMQEQKNRPLGCRGVSHTPHMDRVGIETKIQEQKNHPSGSRGILHTPHMDRVKIETKMQEQIFCPLRGHVVRRMQYAPTAYWQERLYLINSQEGRIETKMQEQKNHPLGSRGVLHTPHTDRVRIETKKQERIFCPLWGHAVGRMPYAPTFCRQETLFPINSQEERIETEMQEQKNHLSDSGAEWHTPHTDRVRIETKIQEQIFCPLRGHAVGRMQYAPTSCRQERLFPINSQEERTETKMQERKKQSINNGAESHTPHMDRVRTETKMQEQIFCPFRGHSVGRMQYAPTSYRQETLFPINSREERIETKIQEQKNRPLGSRAQKHTPHTDRVRIETKMQERIKQSIDSGAEWHMPFMRQGKRDAVWRDTFLEQRAHVAVWRDRRLEERSSHARLQLKTSGENSKPYKSYLVALSEQLRDIFAAYLLQPSN